jgi:hypothetical protein
LLSVIHWFLQGNFPEQPKTPGGCRPSIKESLEEQEFRRKALKTQARETRQQTFSTARLQRGRAARRAPHLKRPLSPLPLCAERAAAHRQENNQPVSAPFRNSEYINQKRPRLKAVLGNKKESRQKISDSGVWPFRRIQFYFSNSQSALRAGFRHPRDTACRKSARFSEGLERALTRIAEHLRFRLKRTVFAHKEKEPAGGFAGSSCIRQ